MTESDPPAGGGSEELVFATHLPISGLDPQVAVENGSTGLIRLAHDNLIAAQPDGTFAPHLATDWEVSDDGLQYTFTLREGVTFHNGEPFTADDVVFTFTRALEEGRSGLLDRSMPTLESVEALGDHEVRFNLSESSSYFLFAVGDPGPQLSIMNRDAVEDGIDTSAEMVGTGPWILDEFEPDRFVTFDANPDYWDGPPASQRLRVLVIPDMTAQAAALRAGEVDLIMPDNPTAASLESVDGVSQYATPSGFIEVALFFHTGRAPFDDERLRQAVALSIDRESLVETAMLGEGTPSAIVPPGFEAGLPWNELPNYTRDLDAARQLLREAGYEDGFEFDLWHTSSRGEQVALVLQAVQSQLAEAGITMNIDTQEQTTWLDGYVNGDWQMSTNRLRWAANPIRQMLPVDFGGPVPPELQEVIDEVSRGTADDLIAGGGLHDLQRASAEIAFPNIGLVVVDARVAYRDGVEGVEAFDFTESWRFLADVSK